MFNRPHNPRPLTLSILFSLLFFSTLDSFGQGLQKDYEIDPSKGVKATDVIHWQLASAQAVSSHVIEAVFYLTTEGGFALYDKKLEFLSDFNYTVSAQNNPETITQTDPITNEPTQVFKSGQFKVIYRSNQPIDPETTKIFTAKIKFIACTDKICLFPYTQELQTNLVFASVTTKEDANAINNTVDTSAGQADVDSQLAEVFKSSTSWWLLFLIVFVGGLLTNLTPCVFPMIPITMRVLAGQTHRPTLAATFYALGILLTYSALGIFAASTGSLFGSLMASKTFNIIFAIVMFVFAITMLGFGNFSKLQMIGSRIGTKQSGSLTNALMMGAGAGLVASPCTGPILAALLAFIAERNDFVRGSALMVVYSFGFALPYVFLGSFTGKISKVKISGAWQVSVKIIFAAIMVCLGLYYLRIPFYSIMQSMSHSWNWVFGVSTILGVASFVAVFLKPQLHYNKLIQLVPVFLIGLALFAGINFRYENAKNKNNELTWIKDEATALEAANQANKPLLIDNWAEWCEACKKMDVTTFVQAEVINELKNNWLLLKMDLTEDNEQNDAYMERYEIASLPTLVLLPANGDRKQMYKIEGYVNSASLLYHIEKFKDQLDLSSEAALKEP